MRSKFIGIPVLTVLLVSALNCSSLPYGTLAAQFPQHRAELQNILTSLQTLRAGSVVRGFQLRFLGRITYHTTSQVLSASEVRKQVPQSLHSVLNTLEQSARGTVLSGSIRDDGTVILVTYTGGAIGSHAGYLYPLKTDAECRDLFQWDMKCVAIPGGDGWMTWQG